MKRIFVILLPIAALLIALSSCKPQVPSKYLQPDEMEDILFDYHIALAMEEGERDEFEPERVATTDDSYRNRLFEAAVLKKHGVSEAEFDSSLVYYTRHSDRFQQIYENISKRLENEAMALGASASDVSNFGEGFSKGDTANVWNELPSAVLTTIAPNNVLSFTIEADSSYHKGDKLMLSFNTQFIFQDGMKDGVALMAVTFMNDSTVTRNVHMQSSDKYDLTVSDDERLGIKSIKGFICLQNNRQATQTTLKLMFLDKIRLVRCHQKEEQPKRDAEPVDTLSDASAEGNESPKPMSTPTPKVKLPSDQVRMSKSKDVNNETQKISKQQRFSGQPVARQVRSGNMQ